MKIGNCPYFLLAVGIASVAAQTHQKPPTLAPDGIPYDNESSSGLMQMRAPSGNLVVNGSFESGRYWPYGWQATDGLTTFWIARGTDGQRCLRIYTDVLEAQWKGRQDEVRAAVEEASRRGGGDPQSLPRNPVPQAPKRIPTQPPYYDTVAGLHGVHYRSNYIRCVPGAIYRFCVDARTEAEGAPRVFVNGFADVQMTTAEGVQMVRRNAGRLEMTLDPCDKQWRRYAQLLHPWRWKTTFGGKLLRPEHLQVQIYAYWKPGNYYFDNVRLEIVGMEEPERDKEPPKPEEPKPKESEKPPELDEEGFPIFNP